MHRRLPPPDRPITPGGPRARARARESAGLAEISEPRFSEKKSLLAPGRCPRAVVKLTVGGFWEIVINLRPHKLGVIDRGLGIRVQAGAPE